jgi:drug/metabolite transporter (DMT)-like permease
MDWAVYAILSAVLYAVAEIIGKYLSDPESEPVYISFFANIYAAFAAMIVAILYWNPIDIPPINSIVGLFGSGFLCAIGTLFYWKALRQLDISEFAFFTRMQLLLVFLGGIIIYRETFALVQMVGAVCIIFGSILICQKKGQIRISSGARLAISSSVFFAGEVMIDRAIIKSYTPQLYTALLYLVISICLAYPAIRLMKIKRKIPKTGPQLILFLASCFYVISAISYYSSYTHGGTVALTAVISQLQIPLVVFYGIFILREKENIPQKISATFFMIIGAILLT